MSFQEALRSATLVAALSFAALAAQSQTAAAQAGGSGSDALHEIDDDRTDLTLNGIPIDDADDLDVYSESGERVGEVEEVLGDRSGAIKALAIEFDDGFLGKDERDVIVPLDRLEIDAERRRVVLKLTRQEIENLPEWRD